MPDELPALPRPHRWFYPTPGGLILALLAAESILFLTARWFPKG
jgi:hypothetical protein